jgi:hypothetical protein
VRCRFTREKRVCYELRHQLYKPDLCMAVTEHSSCVPTSRRRLASCRFPDAHDSWSVEAYTNSLLLRPCSKPLGPLASIRRPQPRRGCNVYNWLRTGAYGHIHSETAQIRSPVSPLTPANATLRARRSVHCLAIPPLSHVPPKTFCRPNTIMRLLDT